MDKDIVQGVSYFKYETQPIKTNEIYTILYIAISTTTLIILNGINAVMIFKLNNSDYDYSCNVIFAIQ